MKRREFIKKDTSVDENNVKNIPENSVNISRKQEIVSTTPLHIDPYIENEIKRSNSLSDKPTFKIENTNYSNDDVYQKSQAKNTKISKLIKVFNNIFQKRQ